MEQDKQWRDEKPVSELRISELENYVRWACALEKEIEKEVEQTEKKKEELRAYKTWLQTNLEYFGKDGWDSKYGKVEIRKRTSVKTPKTEEDKRALFAWLEEKGIFWSTTSVNSQTLNALYKAEFEAGNDKIPGIGEPEVYSTVILKPSK